MKKVINCIKEHNPIIKKKLCETQLEGKVVPLLLSTLIIKIDDYFKQGLNRFKIQNQIINI